MLSVAPENGRVQKTAGFDARDANSKNVAEKQTQEADVVGERRPHLLISI